MNYFKKKELRVVLWSFGAEGKTTLLYQGLKKVNDNRAPLPTIGFNVETIKLVTPCHALRTNMPRAKLL